MGGLGEGGVDSQRHPPGCHRDGEVVAVGQGVGVAVEPLGPAFGLRTQLGLANLDAWRPLVMPT